MDKNKSKVGRSKRHRISSGKSTTSGEPQSDSSTQRALPNNRAPPVQTKPTNPPHGNTNKLAEWSPSKQQSSPHSTSSPTPAKIRSIQQIPPVVVRSTLTGRSQVENNKTTTSAPWFPPPGLIDYPTDNDPPFDAPAVVGAGTGAPSYLPPGAADFDERPPSLERSLLTVSNRTSDTFYMQVDPIWMQPASERTSKFDNAQASVISVPEQNSARPQQIEASKNAGEQNSSLTQVQSFLNNLLTDTVARETVVHDERDAQKKSPPTTMPTIAINESNSATTLSNAAQSQVQLGATSRLAPFQPLILQTTSADNFAPYTPLGRLSVSIGEPNVEQSYAPDALLAFTDNEMLMGKNSALPLTEDLHVDNREHAEDRVGRISVGASEPHVNDAESDDASMQDARDSTRTKRTSGGKIYTDRYNRKFAPSPSTSSRATSASSNNTSRRKSDSVSSSAVADAIADATAAEPVTATTAAPISPPPQSSRQRKSTVTSLQTIKSKSSIAELIPNVNDSEQTLQSTIDEPTAQHCESTQQLQNIDDSENNKLIEDKVTNPVDKVRRRTLQSAMATSDKVEVIVPPKSKSSLDKTAIQKSKQHKNRHQNAQPTKQLPPHPSKTSAMAAGEGKHNTATKTKHGTKLAVPDGSNNVKHEKKSDERSSGHRWSSSKRSSTQLAIAPLTRRSSEPDGKVESRSGGSQVYHYPSFSGRSSADCEYIEVFGGPKPPVETPLTRAIFENAEHNDLIEQVNKLTGGAHNYRAEQGLEDFYGLRVKKFCDRYQLHGTAYLDHLRTDPKYSQMPPHTRRLVRRMHANNEHLVMHLFHIKTHSSYPWIDNRKPLGFGRVINVEAGFRAKAWRRRTELNYKLLMQILRIKPVSTNPEEFLRDSINRLSYQIFIAKQPATSRQYRQRLAYDMKCLQDPNYDRNGPPWWRPLTKFEQSVLPELLEAQSSDSDENFCIAMQKLGLIFEQFHLQEALDMCNNGRGALSVGDVTDPLELLYYMRMAEPVRQGPYKLRSFFFVAIVRLTPPAQILDVQETMKHFFNWRRANTQQRAVEKELRKERKWPDLVYDRLRDIRDATKIYPGSPYSHINIRWLMHNNKMASKYVKPGPYNIKDNLREFQQWAANKHYIITKLPDFGRLPPFQKLYIKALAKYRPRERVFLDNR